MFAPVLYPTPLISERRGTEVLSGSGTAQRADLTHGPQSAGGLSAEDPVRHINVIAASAASLSWSPLAPHPFRRLLSGGRHK